MLILIFTRIVKYCKYLSIADVLILTWIFQYCGLQHQVKIEIPSRRSPDCLCFWQIHLKWHFCLSHPDPSISSFIVNCCFILIVLSDILRCWIDVSSIEIGRMWIAVFGKPIVEYIWKLLTYSGNEGFCKRKVFMDFS